MESNHGNRTVALSEASMPGDDQSSQYDQLEGAYQSEESFASSEMYESDATEQAAPQQGCCSKARRKPCKVQNPVSFVRNLAEAFGWQFLVMLLCAYLFVKGSLYTFIEVGKLPYYQSIGVTGSEYQRLAIAASTPWAMKALFGAISDAVPLCGYSKSIYILVTAILGTGAFALLATVQLSSDSANLAAVMFFFGSLELAVVDLLCEGRYAALMVKRPETGAGLVTWVWACYQIGSLIAAACIGPITDDLDVHVLFYICLPFSMQILIPVLLGFLRENPDPSTSAKLLRDRKSQVRRRKSSRLSVHRQAVADSTSTVAAVSPSSSGLSEEAGPDYESKAAEEEPFVARAEGVDERVDPVANSSAEAASKDTEAEEEEDMDEASDEEDDESKPIVTKCIFRPESCPGSLCCVVNCAKIKQEKRLFFLALFMAVGSLGLSGVSLMNDDILQISYACAISVALCVGAFYCLPVTLAKVNLYMFLQDVLYVQIYGAMDYYYTADYECVHDGPHFSYSFYSSWSNIVGSITGYIGVILFQTVMGKWDFRNVFWVTTIIRMIASLLDVVIVMRWNVAIGIPDEWMYMLGDNIIYQACYMLNFMPAVVLTSKVCPENMEATVYALLAGFQNFGQFVAASVGVYLIGAFGIVIPNANEGVNATTLAPVVSTGASNYTGTCNFDSLPWLIVVCHFFLPMLAIPLTFILIPKAKLTDSINVDESGKFVGATPEAPKKAVTEGVEDASSSLLDSEKSAQDGSTVRRRKRRPPRPKKGPTRSKASSSLIASGAFLKRPSVQGQR